MKPCYWKGRGSRENLVIGGRSSCESLVIGEGGVALKTLLLLSPLVRIPNLFLAENTLYGFATLFSFTGSPMLLCSLQAWPLWPTCLVTRLSFFMGYFMKTMQVDLYLC